MEIPKENMNKHFIGIIIGLLLIIAGGSFYIAKHNAVTKSATNSTSMNGMNMTGDASRRFSVSFIPPTNPQPNQNVPLKFVVYDAATGSPVSNYALLFTKLIHLVIVDNSLTFYNHIHPELNGSVFSITTQFPKSDMYHLYLNFQPSGGTEQQFAFDLPVGSVQPSTPSSTPTDLTRTFGDITVTLSTADGKPFNAASMSDAAQILNFNYKDAKTGQPITDLQPYLGAFGHLTLINERTYEYAHIHPIATDNPNAGGPDVKFLPAALYEKMSPGVYRVFDQFQRNGQLFVADFTINVQ